MTDTPDVAAAVPVVNQTTAALLTNPEVAKHVSGPAPLADDEYNPLAVSKNAGPLGYFPTIASRDVPTDTPTDAPDDLLTEARERDVLEKRAAADKAEQEAHDAEDALAEAKLVADSAPAEVKPAVVDNPVVVTTPAPVESPAPVEPAPAAPVTSFGFSSVAPAPVEPAATGPISVVDGSPIFDSLAAPKTDTPPAF